MPEAVQFYVATLVVVLAVDLIACWALNLQVGTTGVMNFGFAAFMGVGGYAAALVTLGPPDGSGLQEYLFGMSLPFPIPLIVAGVAGAAASFLIGIVVLRRLSADYQAVVFLVVSLMATNIAQNQTWLVNGSAGLVLIPKPLEDIIGLDTLEYQWVYAGFALALCATSFFIVNRIVVSPLGRALRACRDADFVIASSGRNPANLKLLVMVIGGAMAGVCGGLLALFLGVWSPAHWLLPITFVYLTSVLVGGSGNNLGVLVGAVLVLGVLRELARFLPQFGFPGFSEALGWILIGLVMLVVLWFRPEGIVPERKGHVC